MVLSRYCGLTLASEWPLPDLLAPPASATPDIVIRIRDLPPSLPAAIHTPLADITRDEILYKLDGIARYRIAEGGCAIDVHPVPQADPAAVALFLLHPVFVLACIRRRDWLLTASAVSIDGHAVAFSGPSAWGKSSIAASLALDGYPLLADGLLRVERTGDGSLLAHPQAPWTMLWPDLCEHVKPETWTPGAVVRQGLPLRRHILPSVQGPLPLARIGLPGWNGRQENDASDMPAAGSRAVHKILYLTAGRNWLASAGDRRHHLLWAADVAAHCPPETLPLPWGWETYPTALGTVRNWMATDRVLAGVAG